MIISIINLVKGGVGKSTIAVNLAAQMVKNGEAVKLLDLDEAQQAAFNWASKAGIDAISNPSNKEIAELIKQNDNEHLIFDTGGYDLSSSQALMSVSDVIIIPTCMSSIELDALVLLMGKIQKIKQILGKNNLNLVIAPNRIGTHHQRGTKVRNKFDKVKALGYKVAPPLYYRASYQSTFDNGGSVVSGSDIKARTEIYNFCEFIKGVSS